MRTYDYILAMRHQSQLADLYSSDDDDDYDDASDYFSDTSDKPSMASRFFCQVSQPLFLPVYSKSQRFDKNNTKVKARPYFFLGS